MNFHIVVFAGDGIGPEICEESKKVLNRVGEVFGHKFEYEPQDAGGIAIDKFDTPLARPHPEGLPGGPGGPEGPHGRAQVGQDREQKTP